MGHRSCIDHFITSENVYREIVFNHLFDEVDNTSTHLPVEMCFRTSEFQRIKIEVEQSNSNDQLQWHKAGVNDIINYRRVMDDALSNITIPDGLHCRAVNCKYGVHHSAIEQTCNDVISSCIHAGQTCVPSVKVNGRKRRKCIPGNTMNYTKNTAVHLSSIQYCIMCANDTRSGPLFKKLLDFITFETSEQRAYILIRDDTSPLVVIWR